MELKKSFSKGIATINVKTSNFMEENKLKTQISTLENEIEKLKFALGEYVCVNWGTEAYTEQSVSEIVQGIREKYVNIENLRNEIELLYKKEREILGGTAAENAGSGDKIFCSQCGKESKRGYKFCEQCGNRLEG